jgi:CRISPR-associated protein Cas2
MLYLVCYDISSDLLRGRMSKALLDFGTRIQESVFECPLNDELLERMMARLERLELGDDDRVRIYRICGACVDRIRIYGPGDVTTEPDYYLV